LQHHLAGRRWPVEERLRGDLVKCGAKADKVSHLSLAVQAAGQMVTYEFGLLVVERAERVRTQQRTVVLD